MWWIICSHIYVVFSSQVHSISWYIAAYDETNPKSVPKSYYQHLGVEFYGPLLRLAFFMRINI
jgi:hypothetical protein